MTRFGATILRIPTEQYTLFQAQKQASMVWASVTSCKQKTPLLFIDQSVKINQQAYLDMLKNRVVS